MNDNTEDIVWTLIMALQPGGKAHPNELLLGTNLRPMAEGLTQALLDRYELTPRVLL